MSRLERTVASGGFPRVPSERRTGARENPRWYTLLALYLAVSIVMLDATVVYLALPSIQSDLAFPGSSLVWVVNAYLVPSGGFQLLCGRLGDHYGHRKIFLLGVTLFTVASLGCGLVGAFGPLIVARAVQGVAAAAVIAVSLSLIAQQFHEVALRAQALSLYAFVAAGGNIAGVLLGGAVTAALSWRWIFLINVPIGALAYALCLMAPPRETQERKHARLDVGGAALITAAMMLAMFSVLQVAKAGWRSTNSLLSLCSTLFFFMIFILVETRVKEPIIPLSLFRQRNFATGVIVGALWAGAQATWTFIATLYLQDLLGYNALEAGLAFLPTTAITAVLSLGTSKSLILRFGSKPPLVTGLLLFTAGLTLLTQISAQARFATDLLPGMVLIGFGVGISYSSFLLIALGEVKAGDHGIASGVLNSSTVMGGAISLAVVATAAAVRTGHLVADGVSLPMALGGGYHLALGIGVVLVGTATAIALLFLRIRPAEPGSLQ